MEPEGSLLYHTLCFSYMITLDYFHIPGNVPENG